MTHYVRRLALVCKRCDGSFECVSTMARKFCACRTIVERENNRIDRVRYRAKVAASLIKPKEERPRLIPYAGYDEHEEHL